MRLVLAAAAAVPVVGRGQPGRRAQVSQLDADISIPYAPSTFVPGGENTVASVNALVCSLANPRGSRGPGNDRS